MDVAEPAAWRLAGSRAVGCTEPVKLGGVPGLVDQQHQQGVEAWRLVPAPEDPDQNPEWH